MSKKHRKILEALFAKPVPAGIRWNYIVAMLKFYGAEISEGRGSRLRIELNGEEAVFHRPHPGKETDKGAVASMRRFLENAGVKP